MIKKFIDKLLGKSPAAPGGKPNFGKRMEIPVSVHGIDPSVVDDLLKNSPHAKG